MTVNKKDIYVGVGGLIPRGFIAVRNYKDAVRELRTGNVGRLSLGYTLGNEELGRTGMDVVDIICYDRLFADRIYIHEKDRDVRGKMYKKLVFAREQNFIDSRIEVFSFGV